MKEFFTARELAEAATARGLRSFPQTERGVRFHAAREGWNDLPDNLCRKRDGRGGGLEYHYSVLPAELRAAIHWQETKALQLAAQKQQATVDTAKRAVLNTMSLSARQRTVMEKRAEILIAIERYKTFTGSMSDANVIGAFVDAQDEYPRWKAAEAVRDEGKVLSVPELALLAREPLLVSPEGFGLTADALGIANNRPKGNAKIGRSTIYEWLQLRRQSGVSALAPALTKEVEPVPAGFVEFLSFYARPQKPTASEALGDYMKTVTDPAKALTIDQVRYTLRTKLNNIEKNVGREGLLTLRSRMAYIQRSTENLFPTTIYTGDGKTFDAEVANPLSGKPFKPEITSIVDVATRLCVGFAASRKENVISVTEALRKSCTEHGIPAIFYVDRGPGYKNKTFDADVNGLMGRLSITKMHALPYNSQAKGIIERFNGTVWNPLARKLPTYLGESMDKEAASSVHKATRRDIKEFGGSRLLPSWADFLAMCEQAIAEYNNAPHSALPRIDDPVTGKRRHMSPIELWAQHVAEGFEPVPVEPELVDDLFRPYEIRVARRSLVDWNTNTYFHKALEGYHSEKVMVGYDFADASKVWVREIDREAGQPGKLICVADFAGNKVDYVPRSYQQAAEDRRHQGRVKRNDNKRRDIDAERFTPYLLEQSALQPVPVIDVVPQSRPTMPVLIIDNVPASPTPEASSGASFASSDEALAAWAIKNPDKLTSNQVRVLRDCLSRQTAAEHLRMSGIDVDALRSVIRAAA